MPARLVAAATLTLRNSNMTLEQTEELLAWVANGERSFKTAIVLHGFAGWSCDARWRAILDSLKQDADPKVREAVINALCLRGGPDCMKSAIGLLRAGESEARRYLLAENARYGALIRAGDPVCADAMAELLTSGDADAAAKAACALGVIHDGRAPVDKLAELAMAPVIVGGIRIVNDGECSPRTALIELAISGNADATRALQELVRIPNLDPDFLQNLVKTNEPVLCKTVEDLALDTTVSAAHRLAAATSIYFCSSKSTSKPAMVQLLRELLKDQDLNHETQSSICNVLLRTGEPRDLDAVFEQMRKVSVENASDIGDLAYRSPRDVKGFVDRLAKLVMDEGVDLNLRSEAAGALVGFCDSHTLEVGRLSPSPVESLIRISKAGETTDLTRQRLWNAMMGTKDPVAKAFVKTTLETGAFDDRMKVADGSPILPGMRSRWMC